MCVYAVLPRKGTQVILYPEAPGVLLHDKVKKFMPMSTTFTPLTAGIGSESETAAEKKKDATCHFMYITFWVILNYVEVYFKNMLPKKKTS